MKSPYIVYSLSKGRTTQKFSKKKFQDILKEINIFLRNCTTTNLNEPNSVELKAYTAYDDTDPADLLNRIISKTKERFGTSCKEPIANHYPSGKPHSTSKYTWELPKERFQEAIQYINENSPISKSNFGPLELFIAYKFKLINIESKEELPNQELNSIFFIWFSRSKACSPTLFFPFEKADQNFWSYIDSLIPFMPFKFEEKYLKIAHLNKQGEVKSFKKVERPVLP